MKLYAPNKYTYWTGIVFGLAGILGEFASDVFSIDLLSENSFLFLFIAFLDLGIGPLVKKR